MIVLIRKPQLTVKRLREVILELTKPAHLLLGAMVLLSAFAVIFNSYKSRQLFHELQTLQQEVGSLQSQWRQLLVEEGAFSAHVRVEHTAAQQLSMQIPGVEETVAVHLK